MARSRISEKGGARACSRLISLFRYRLLTQEYKHYIRICKFNDFFAVHAEPGAGNHQLLLSKRVINLYSGFLQTREIITGKNALSSSWRKKRLRGDYGAKSRRYRLLGPAGFPPEYGGNFNPGAREGNRLKAAQACRIGWFR